MRESPVIDLRAPVETPQDGIVSRTIHNDDSARVVLFSFAQGQQLSDHTASVPVTLIVGDGDADIVLDGEQHEGHTGSWVYIGANVPHSVVAKTPVTMLLTLLKG